MAHERINVFVGATFPELRDHLRSQGRSAGERLKVLASIGAMVCDGELPCAPSKTDRRGGESLRINIRLSPAYREVADLLQGLHKKGGVVARLANEGYQYLQHPTQLSMPSDSRHVSASETASKVVEPEQSEPEKSDVDRLGLAAGLMSDATLWR